MSARISCYICLALFAVAVNRAPAKKAPEPKVLTNADVLPLAIEPTVQVRKIKEFYLGPERNSRVRATDERTLAFERRRLLYGAITANDVRDRYGDYYTFFWRTKDRRDLTLRLEYRQQYLGGWVQAREVDYPGAKGSFKTNLEVTGDDYLEQGRITAWRVLLIENHRTIVAFSQSYLWR